MGRFAILGIFGAGSRMQFCIAIHLSQLNRAWPDGCG